MTKEISKQTVVEEVRTEKVYAEESYEPNLSDFAFFLSVMQVKKAYRNILSIILDEEDLELLEVKGLRLEDGTKKIFLNMRSTNGKPELISLLQYMKETRLDNPNISVMDKRLTELDRIVREVKESEEWEAVSMSIYGRGIEKGKEDGENRKLIEQICKKLKKNKPVECISDELEEPLETIRKICIIAERYAPDYDCDTICREWEKHRQG